MSETTEAGEMPAKLGGGWFHSAELVDGESIEKVADVLHKPARSSQGGKLYLTNKRLVYLPDRWAAVVGDGRAEWPLDRPLDAGMTRGENAGVIFRNGNLLLFECMYVMKGDERHLFSTRLPLTDREWVAAIKAASQDAAPPEPEGEETPGDAVEPPPEAESADDQAPAGQDSAGETNA